MTALLADWRCGNSAALEDLVPLVYRELRQIASRALRRERPGHTLQSTALANEAYLKLAEQRQVNFVNREHFFAIASQITRRILVSHAREKKAAKRGGGAPVSDFDEMTLAFRQPGVDLVALDDALQALSRMDPQQGRIVELRFFGGLSIAATARVLGVSSSTITREWGIARAWLRREIERRN